MLLATMNNGTRDGQLIVVARDRARFLPATAVAPTLQAALDDWDAKSIELNALFESLQADASVGKPLSVASLHSPLPRAYEWVDGSAYLNHVRLVRKARNAAPPATLETDPLVYQGGSGKLLAPTEDIPLPTAKWGLDFEAEMVVILGDTPQGTKADEAGEFIKLVTICNDITFRGLIPTELKKGFGFFQGKPATTFAPFALTPDEFDGAFVDGRMNHRLKTHYNGELVGDVDAGPEMHFSFHQLIQHICKTRAFTAGTLLGSGTVSNEDRERGISCLAERRMIEIIDNGEATTPFMSAGDTVKIEMLDDNGVSLFGAIEQKVVVGGRE